MSTVIRNPILRGFNPGSLHRPRRRRLLHRHVHIGMVSGRADPSLARSGPLASTLTSAHAAASAQHARRPRLVRRLGAVPDLRRRPLSSRVHRRQAIRADLAARKRGRIPLRFPQLPRHERADRRRVVRSSLPQQQRSSLALPRRRRPEVPAEHVVGPPTRTKSVRGNRHAGVLARGAAAGRRAPRHLLRHAARFDRRPAPLQARRLLPSAHRGGRHRLGSRGDHGARADDRRAPTSCIPTSTC